MITTNVIYRVFKLKHGAVVGTCFTIDVEGKQFFVTAKHVLQSKDQNQTIVSEFKDGDTLEILRNERWVSFKANLIGHHAVADVSVFSMDGEIGGYELPATSAGMIYGQDVYFLGFPYGLVGAAKEMNRDFPFPFVKKAIVSAMFFEQPGQLFLLDGHNNSGFSGGPVVFKAPGSNNFQVAGVISGFQMELEEKDGKLVPIEKTNSGIIVAYSIKNATDLINSFLKK